MGSLRTIAHLSCLTVAVVTLCVTVESHARKGRAGWKRGKVHVRTLAKAFATLPTLGIGKRDIPPPDPSLAEAGALLRVHKPRSDFPWPSRSLERNVGKPLVPFYDLVDERGWVRRADVRKKYGAATLRSLDFILERTDGGSGLVGLSHNGLMQRLPDNMLRAMTAGLRLVPAMRAYSAIVKRYGKVQVDELDMRGQIVGNTAGLLLRAGTDPQRTRVYGKSYSFDARVGALLHTKGFDVQGPRFRDNADHVAELRRAQARLYRHLRTLGDEGRPLLDALRSYGGLLRDDPWVQAERREEARIEANIERQIASIGDPKTAKGKRFLLVDDGGDYLELAARVLEKKKYAPFRRFFTAVEQTSKGRSRMLRVKPPFPVVDVAKSWAKNIYGNPMFGHAISKQARRLVDALKKEQRIFIPEDSCTVRCGDGYSSDERDGPQQRAPTRYGETKSVHLGSSTRGHHERVGGLQIRKRAVIIGASGNIARAVARSLRRAGYQVGGYDIAGGEKHIAGMKIYETLDEALREGHLVFSCAGEKTLGPREFEKMPTGAVVINGGSAGEIDLPRDVARNAILHPQPTSPLAYVSETRRRALYEAVREGRGGRLKATELVINKEHFLRFQGRLVPLHGTDPHEVWVTKSGKEILVARGGGVINFPLDVSHPRAGKLIPGRYIQLEIGLLHLGMRQALKETTPGLRELERAPQKDLVEEVQSDLARHGESLLSPSW